MNTNTGGPAFSCDRIPTPDGRVVTSDGMTMRDYFAAKAMQAYWSDPDVADDLNTAAMWAYDMADAMMKARNQ